MNIPNDIIQKLEYHSKQFGISIEELKNDLIRYYKDFLSKYPKRDNWKLAYTKLRHILKEEQGGLRSPAKTYTAFFIGETGLRDIMEQMRRKIDRDPELSEKYKRGEEYLDYRTGREGEPLKKHQYIRTLYGFGNIGTDLDSVKFVRLTFFGENALNVNYNHLDLYKFRANERNQDRQKNFIDLSASRVTRFRKVSKEKIDYESLIRNSGYPIFTFKDNIEEIYNMTKDNYIPILLEAYVANITLRKTSTGSIRLLIDDEEYTGDVDCITAFIPPYLKINFGEQSRVIFLGNISKRYNARYDREEYIFNTKGFYPLEQEKTDPPIFMEEY